MVYVLSDIHGQQRRFDSIMEQINLQPEDTLYVLGDVIDRNPYGIQILRQLMSMPNAKMILGNHEAMMLDALYYNSDDDLPAAKYKNGRRRSLCSQPFLPSRHLCHQFMFLRRFPVVTPSEKFMRKDRTCHLTSTVFPAYTDDWNRFGSL